MITNYTEVPEIRAGLSAAHPWNALGRPEDIADAALFLASDEA
jgi:NAD(P)-dependent dehydrogenase (short-subunit alcohol dehydrogenase family)